MRTVRLIGFTLAILLGIAAGLISGWLYFPSEISTTTPENLRADYKADYVLMVAEVYATDGDLENAIALLNEIKPGDPLGAVQRGLLTAQEMGYADWEMRLIADLEISLQQKLSQGAGQ
mgnify:FL=1